jgi:AGCS family alanine or glycine:cation symporter
VWSAKIPSVIEPGGGDFTHLEQSADGHWRTADAPRRIEVRDGYVVSAGDAETRVGWHEVEVERLYLDPEHTRPFNGFIHPGERRAVGDGGEAVARLHGMAVESGAPLTKLAFSHGLPGNWGGYIVALSVLLFAISTAISWSYYGDRCANYLFGAKAILPYKVVYVAMHFVGSLVALQTVWTIGDIALGIVILPNLIALVWLSGKVKTMTDSYFERRPWEGNAVAHQRWLDKKRSEKGK